MNLILSIVMVSVGSGKVLNQISAEIDINDLHTSADAQNWLAGSYESVKKCELGLIQFPVYGERTLVFFTKPRGMNVTSSGEKKTVEGRQVRGIKSGFIRNMTSGQSIFIVFGVFRYAGDEDMHIVT